MPHYFNSPHIHYLEVPDFTLAGRLIPSVNPVSGTPVFTRPTVIMVQGNFCGYCTQFKPAFEAVAHQFNDKIDFATIQIDSEQASERFSPALLRAILGTEMQGVPTIAVVNKGKPAVYDGPRTAQGLAQWISTMSY